VVPVGFFLRKCSEPFLSSPDFAVGWGSWRIIICPASLHIKNISSLNLQNLSHQHQGGVPLYLDNETARLNRQRQANQSPVKKIPVANMGGFRAVEDRPTPKEVYNWRLYLQATIIATGSLLYVDGNLASCE
jgi:hypothetical protein